MNLQCLKNSLQENQIEEQTTLENIDEVSVKPSQDEKGGIVCENLPSSDCTALQEELDKCEKQLQKLAAPQTPFFRQYIANLLDRMNPFANQVNVKWMLLLDIKQT